MEYLNLGGFGALKLKKLGNWHLRFAYNIIPKDVLVTYYNLYFRCVAVEGDLKLLIPNRIKSGLLVNTRPILLLVVN
jgi:hypothetical protein